jgi:hypothetical protein
MYHHGWLMVGESNGNYRELINHARTAAYLQSSTALGCSKVANVLDDGGCSAYPWVPPTLDGEPNEAAIVAPNGWYQQLYSTPELDDAPWYSDSYPESAEALGFWITEWTGLDSGHIRREVTAVSSRGGQFGRSYSASREMGLEIILLGESEAALDYLFRWLDATLSSVCYTCQTDSILIRRICPDFDVLDLDNVINGVVELREVGMVSGLVWGAPPIERQGCYIRTVNVTLGAMDPCMYAPCETVEIAQTMDWVACAAASNLDEDRSDCRPSCSEMPGVCRTTFDYTVETVGASAPIITLTPPLPDVESLPLRIRTYVNMNDLAPDQLCGAPLLAELYVTALPPWSAFQYDMAGRQVRYRDAATGDWINGAAFIEPNAVGIPRWPALACGSYTTVVEPSSFCYDPLEIPTSVPEPEMLIQERMGCV